MMQISQTQSSVDRNSVYMEFEDEDNSSSLVCNYKLTQINSEVFKAHR
jgi:hypothetical protein